MLEDHTIFKLDKLANQPYEKDFIVQMDVTIEMNLDLGIINRTGYNILDVMSDIGGIQSIIITTASVLAGLWNYKHFDTFLTSKLFKIREFGEANSKDPLSMIKAASGTLKFIKLRRYCNIGHYIMDLIPQKCRCCRKTKT